MSKKISDSRKTCTLSPELDHADPVLPHEEDPNLDPDHFDTEV